MTKADLAKLSSNGLTDPRRVVLGTFSASHLGDVLCMSPIPRLLTEHRGLHVYVSRQPHTLEVFSHNPYVVGFAEGATVEPSVVATGDGHIMHRLLQGFELPLDVSIRPEIYLTAEETAWAVHERSKWPANRPACILSSVAVSDRSNVERVSWSRIAEVVLKHFTLIQPTLREPCVPGAVEYKGLSLRQYFSLFSVADYFIGGTSGGSHLAAAFDIPSLIVIWRSLEQSLQFPTSNHGFKASFLYPQHWFISAEDITPDGFKEAILEGHLAEMMSHGRNGRPTPVQNCSRNAWGLSPKAPIKISRTGSGRFVRVPTVYGKAPDDPMV